MSTIIGIVKKFILEPDFCAFAHLVPRLTYVSEGAVHVFTRKRNVTCVHCTTTNCSVLQILSSQTLKSRDPFVEKQDCVSKASSTQDAQRNAKQMEPVYVNGVFTLHASNIKGFAFEFARARPVWMRP